MDKIGFHIVRAKALKTGFLFFYMRNKANLKSIVLVVRNTSAEI